MQKLWTAKRGPGCHPQSADGVAIEIVRAADNPTLGVKSVKFKTDGLRTWTETTLPHMRPLIRSERWRASRSRSLSERANGAMISCALGPGISAVT